MSGDLSSSIECAEADEQFSRLSDSSGWWRCQPGQLEWIGRAPIGQFEQQWRQVGIEDFRRATRRQQLVLPSGPEAGTDARFEATCTTFAAPVPTWVNFLAFGSAAFNASADRFTQSS